MGISAAFNGPSEQFCIALLGNVKDGLRFHQECQIARQRPEDD